MVTVIQGSNRRGNSTRPFAEYITEVIADQGLVSTLIDLEFLPGEILHADMYGKDSDHPFLAAAEESMRTSDRWIFVFPEYNGSFPGVLKLFIDAMSVRDYSGIFEGKVAALVGTSSGRSGNIRGVDQFGAVLQHMGTVVMPQGLPIGGITQILDSEDNVADADTRRALEAYVKRLINYPIC